MQLNNQPPEKLVKSSGESLDVHSVFYTIQGEGPMAGQPAVFIRLAGCNIQCPQCDTEYTKHRQTMPVDALVDLVLSLRAWDENSGCSSRPLAVITGGEPFRQNLTPFVERLRLRTQGWYRVQIETNGTLPMSPGLDPRSVTVVCSPKGNLISRSIAEFCHYYKFVISSDCVNPVDGLPTRALGWPVAQLARPPIGTPACQIYLQPADEKDVAINTRNLEAAVKSCMKYGYTLGVQMHKLANVQ